MKAAHKKILNRFEQAAKDLAWIGAQMPEAHEDIRKEYRRARAELVRIIGNGEPETVTGEEV